MNDKKIADLDFGLNAEINIKERLEVVFGELKPKKAKNDPFDFDGDNLVIEVKSRRINHNKYDTLFFGKNKFDKGKLYQMEGVRVVFVFNCLDGIYYWEQNEEECFHKKGGRFDRGRPEVQMLTNVPIKYLKNLEPSTP
tara:strand:+ start:225 stop:641 length:417 start_codon:yes stop_codon:yes gene_type:complete